MPIATDSDAWMTADKPPRFHKTVLSFLREHPDQAYRARELADELLETTFAIGETRDRLEDDLSEEEFERRLYTGELPGGDDHHPVTNMFALRHIESALRRLIDAGLVDYREVDAAEFDLPDNDTVFVFAYAGDVSHTAPPVR